MPVHARDHRVNKFRDVRLSHFVTDQAPDCLLKARLTHPELSTDGSYIVAIGAHIGTMFVSPIPLTTRGFDGARRASGMLLAGPGGGIARTFGAVRHIGEGRTICGPQTAENRTLFSAVFCHHMLLSLR